MNPHDPIETHRDASRDADPRSVDAALRAAGARQRRALVPSGDEASPTLALRRDDQDAALPPRPAAVAPWRRALAAAAALALVVGGWWALRSSAPTSAPPARPLVADAPPAPASILDAVLGNAVRLTLPPTDALTTELNRMQTDLVRVLDDLPRVSLRWDTPAQAEPRTERDAPSGFPSA